MLMVYRREMPTENAVKIDDKRPRLQQRSSRFSRLTHDLQGQAKKKQRKMKKMSEGSFEMRQIVIY